MTRTRSATSREERRANIRRNLLRATEQLIGEGESYASVSIERLATAAGVSRATFYIYFDSKADLLRNGFDEAMEELGEAATHWFALDAASTRSDLERAITELLTAFRQHGPLIVAVTDESAEDSELRDQVAELLTATNARLAAMIMRGQDDGWIDATLMPVETASWALWLLERGLTQLVATADAAGVSLLARTLADMAWHTLRT
jgi:AcrR family transcriptional regulator